MKTTLPYLKIIKSITLINIFLFLSLLPIFSGDLINYKLKNGMEVILIEKRDLPIVNINIIYKVGCKDEYNGITGISHMLEHMNFRGSQHFPDGFMEKFVTKNGGIENASTSFDYTRYYVTIRPEAIEQVLSVYADNMVNLQLDNDKFLKERSVVYQERLWRVDNSPDGYLYYAIHKLAYLEAPYRWTPIGFTSDILNWSINDISDFYKKHYSPDNAAILIVGDIDKDKVRKIVEEKFSNIKPSGYKGKFTEEPEQNGERRLNLQFISSNKKLALAYHIPPLADNSTPALDILTYYLTGRDNSILKRKLIREKKLISQIDGGNQERKHSALYLIFATINQESDFKTVEDAIYEELQRIKNGDISEEEFEISKNKAIFDNIYSKESISSIGQILSFYLALGRVDYYNNYQKLISQTTKDDLKAIASQIFNKNNLSVINLYPIDGKASTYTPPISGDMR